MISNTNFSTFPALHVHKKSKHPLSILKNNPDSINKRLSEISSDRQCFENAKTLYQEALNKSGYNYNPSYNEPRNEIQHSWKNQPRNILWYNPPFSKNVKTNVGKCFLSLIDQHFSKSHSLHIDRLLLTREAYWTAQLCTLSPHGLNKRR